MAPVRSYYDGTMSYKGFVANAILLVVTSSLTGFKFALMTKLTRSLFSEHKKFRHAQLAKAIKNSASV